jgi:hypothetical protein
MSREWGVGNREGDKVCFLLPIPHSPVPFSLDIVTDTAYKLPLSVTNRQTSDEKRRGVQATRLALLGFKIGS